MLWQTNKPLHGVLPVLHTPFTDAGAIDPVVLEREIDWALEVGADGVVVAMVSEVLRLGYHGRRELASLVCQAVRGRGFTVISVGAESIAEAVEFAQHAEGLGVFRSDGSLQLGVNQWAEAGTARSAPKQFLLLDEGAANIYGAVYNSLRFFAVSYDSTAAAGQAKFYIGSRQNDAKLVTTSDYARGPAGAKIAPQLSIGNVAPQIRAQAVDRTAPQV